MAAEDELVKPSSFALFHILSKGGSAADLEALFDIWDDLPVTALKPGGHGGYSYDGIGYDVSPDEDEVVFPVHVVAANCGDIRMFIVRPGTKYGEGVWGSLWLVASSCWREGQIPL